MHVAPHLITIYNNSVAITYAGEQPNDLPFKRGEVLIVIEPCNVVYWYLAENNQGQRGVIPITYVKVHKIITGQHIVTYIASYGWKDQ